MASSRRRALAGALVVAAVGLAGCGGGGGAADSATASTSPATATSDAPTPESTTTTTAAPTEEEAILAAYHGYWDTWLAANDPPNPDHPDLERYYTGPALERAKSAVSDNRLIRQVIRLPEESVSRHEARLVALDSDRATVSDCSVDDAIVVDEPSGRVLNDQVVTELLSASIARIDGTWKVASVRRVGEWTGDTACVE
jgi:hypothetical protein